MVPAIKLAEMGYRPSARLTGFKQKLDAEYPNEKPEIVADIYKAITGVEAAARNHQPEKRTRKPFIHGFYKYTIASLAVAAACFYMGSTIFLLAGTATLLCSAGLYKFARIAIKAEQELKISGKIYHDAQARMAVRELCSQLLLKLEPYPVLRIKHSKARIKNPQDYYWENSMFYLRDAYTNQPAALEQQILVLGKKL